VPLELVFESLPYSCECCWRVPHEMIVAIVKTAINQWREGINK